MSKTISTILLFLSFQSFSQVLGSDEGRTIVNVGIIVDTEDSLESQFKSKLSMNGFDIVIYSYGTNADIMHYKIIDTSVSLDKYELLADKFIFRESLILQCRNCDGISEMSKFNYYVFDNDFYAYRFFKKIYMYKKRELIGCLSFANVSHPNVNLPYFREIELQLKILSKLAGEKLNEIMGIGNYVDLGERGVDTRIGRLNFLCTTHV